MSGLVDGKTAVVTGGASGNGRGIATRLAEEGSDIVIADIRSDPRMGGDPTDEVITNSTDSRAKFVECDVTNRDEVRAAVDAASEFGGIDVMVNNAGIAFDEKLPVVDITREHYDNLLEINLAGVFFGSKIAAQEMLDRDQGGNIINLSSIGAFGGTPNNSLYNLSKAAVQNFTKSLAGELGPHHIRVNVLHPGIIETAFTAKDVDIIGAERGDTYRENIPIPRFGKPEDVGDAAVFLASDLASYVNGHSLTVDGGLSVIMR